MASIGRLNHGTLAPSEAEQTPGRTLTTRVAPQGGSGTAPPLQKAESITCVDADGQTKTLDPSQYTDEPDPTYLLSPLQVLTLQPGDKIIVAYEEQYNPEQKRYLRAQWAERFGWPAEDIVVVDAGTTVGVVRKSTAEVVVRK